MKRLLTILLAGVLVLTACSKPINGDTINNITEGGKELVALFEQAKSFITESDFTGVIQQALESKLPSELQEKFDKYKNSTFEDTLTYEYLITTFDIDNWKQRYVCIHDKDINLVNVDASLEKFKYSVISLQGKYENTINDLPLSEIVDLQEDDTRCNAAISTQKLGNLMSVSHKWKYKTMLDFIGQSENGEMGYQLEFFEYNDKNIVFIWNSSRVLNAIYIEDVDDSRDKNYDIFVLV